MIVRAIVCGLGVWAVGVSLCAAAGPPERADIVPAHWKTVNIVWKANWAKTLEANPIEAWQAAIAAEKSVAAAAGPVLALQRIELLKAMLQRFDKPAGARMEAYREIARGYGQLGDRWRQTWWLWKLGQDFPDRKEALTEACAAVTALPLETAQARPSLREWEPALREVLAMAAAGKIAWDDPSVEAAYRKIALLIAAQHRYDEIPAFLAELEAAGKRARGVLAAGGDLLAWFGHERLAADWYLRAGQAAEHGGGQGTELIWGIERNVALQARWDAIAQGRDAGIVRKLQVADVQAMLLAAAQADGFLRADGGRYLSPWTAMQTTFASLTSEQRDQLEHSQDAAAGYRAQAITAWQDRDELLGLLRRYPWSPAVHASLLAMADRALRRDRPCWAAAACRDVLALSRDEAVLAQARIGLWLAQAQDPRQHDDLRLQLAALPANAELPWQGQKVPVGRIAPRLVGSEPGQHSLLSPEAEKLLGVSGSHSLPEPKAVRYRLDTDPRAQALVAEDPHTGKQLWTTTGREELAGLRFWTRPMAADGRVVATALTAEVRGSEPVIELVCLDEQDGKLIWRRALGQATSAAVALGRPDGGLTLCRGSIYCATGVGLVARCDLRDGLVEWVSAYGSSVSSADRAWQQARRGDRPMLVGQKLIAAPRDHSGLVAMNARSGQVRWQKPMLPSDSLVGVCGPRIVTVSRHALAAVDTQSGKRLWTRPFDHSTGSQAAVLADDVILTAGRTVYRIAAASGRTVTEKLLPPAADARWVFTEAAHSTAEFSPICWPTPQPDRPTRPLTLPLVEVMRVNFSRPRAVFSAGAWGPAGAFCIVSGNRIGYVRTSPKVAMVWQRALGGAPPAVHMIGDRVFVVQGRELSALGESDGALKWSLTLPFSAEIIEGDDRVLLAATGAAKQEPFAAVVDPVSGTLRWARSLNEPACLNTSEGIKGAVVRRSGGAAHLGIYMMGLFGDQGTRGAEIVLDESSGNVREIKSMPFSGWWPNCVAITKDWVATLGAGPKTCVLGRDGHPNPGPNWNRGWSPGVAGNYRGYYRMFQTTSGAWYRMGGTMYFWDIPAGKEVTYVVPGEGWGHYRIVDVQEHGSVIMLQSLLCNRVVHRSQRHLQGPIRNSQIFIDTFERATGKHLQRFKFAGVSDAETSHYRYEPVTKLLPAAAIVSDATSLRVYAAPAAR